MKQISWHVRPHVPADIVLIGYYGCGNLGDDLLMMVSAQLIAKSFPQASLAIRTGAHRPYVARLLSKDVEQIPFGTRDHHRLIVHGGGGNFFDFGAYSFIERIRNKILLAAGPRTAVHMDATLRNLVRRPRMTADVRIGLGIGVGTYSSGSPALLDALPVLADFDALWVRDEDSIDNLAALGLSPFVVRGSDLAFLWDSWCPPELQLLRHPRSKRPKVGLILRDWPPGTGCKFAGEIAGPLIKLAECFDLSLISFDHSGDLGTLYSLARFKTAEWLPQQVSLAEFLLAIASQDILLTSRAHGAICGTCLGRPSVILEIEPKLKAIHKLLPNASVLATPPFKADALIGLIEQALAMDAGTIASDAIRNRQASERALRDVFESAGL